MDENLGLNGNTSSQAQLGRFFLCRYHGNKALDKLVFMPTWLVSSSSAGLCKLLSTHRCTAKIAVESGVPQLSHGATLR